MMARPTLPTPGQTNWDTVLASAINDVSDRADTALATSASPLGGVVLLDSFSGANDDAKLTAALSYAAAQSHIPAVLFSGRDHSFSQGGRTPFTGMKLYGPYGARGQKNLEIAAGANSNHRVMLNCGTGASSWFNGTGTYFDIHVVDLAFQSGTSAQFWHQATGTIYACVFDNLTFYGFNGGVFGNATSPALITACNFRGIWEVLGWSSGPQFHFAGSDSVLWRDGQMNLQSGGGSGGGTPAMWLESQQKTSLGYVYITCQNGFGGIRVSGSSDVALFGGTYEGMNAGAPSTVPVLDVQGGIVKSFGTDFNYVTTANGAITQSGGSLDLFAPTYWRASAAASTLPLLYQTGGTAMIQAPECRQAGESCVARWSDGTTQTLTRANKTVVL